MHDDSNVTIVTSVWYMNISSVCLHSINDGILEVAGLYSSLHIARLQVNMADPLRLGQARTVKVSELSGLVQGLLHVCFSFKLKFC